MGQLDEVSTSIGRLQGTLEAHGQVHSQILVKLDNFEKNLNKKFVEYDEHIQRLNADMEQRKGAKAVMLSMAGFIGAGMVKLMELVLK